MEWDGEGSVMGEMRPSNSNDWSLLVVGVKAKEMEVFLVALMMKVGNDRMTDDSTASMAHPWYEVCWVTENKFCWRSGT